MHTCSLKIIKHENIDFVVGTRVCKHDNHTFGWFNNEQ